MLKIGQKFLFVMMIILIFSSPKSYAQATPGLKGSWVPVFMLMTEQLTTGMIQQVEIIGTFFDAKHQLETQRLFQQKVAEAHKDYQPSEQMCEIGTFVRDLAKSQERTKIAKNAIQNASLARALGTGDVKTMDDQGSGSDENTRRKLFIDKFCNITDNANQNQLLCDTSKHPEQQNADINYTQTIDMPLTLNFDLTDTEVTRTEQNIFAFLDQIFMNDAFPGIARSKTILHNFIKPYQEMRSLAAMRSVAQDSFAHIIGEKTIDTSDDTIITPYIFALLREMGFSDDAMLNYISATPSYYAQMEILTKTILQHPEFISNLYDKPANVKRIRTALSAIKLMQERDIHNAMQRREMLTSMILEMQLRDKQIVLTNEIESMLSRLPGEPIDTRHGIGETGVYGGDGPTGGPGVGTFNPNSVGGGF